MSNDKKYIGTDGLNLEVAISRVFELLDNAFNNKALGGEDKKIYEEAKQLIGLELRESVKRSRAFSIVKDNLTNKQWQKIFKES